MVLSYHLNTRSEIVRLERSREVEVEPTARRACASWGAAATPRARYRRITYNFL